MALGLLAQEHEQIDRLGGMSEVALSLAGQRVGRVAHRNSRRAREHREEPRQVALGLPRGSGSLPLGVRRGLARGRGWGRLVVPGPPAPVRDLERFLWVFGSHRSEPSIRKNPCCIIAYPQERT